MQEITVTFPDGTKKEYPYQTPLYEIAEDYQPKMKQNILGIKINGEIFPCMKN